MRLFVLSFLLIPILFGCQTNPMKQYEQLRPGMDKHDVMEIMGGPTVSERYKGMDRWIYAFYDRDGIRQHKEVHFADGVAVYIGEKPKPEISAEELDKRNAEYNKASENEEKVIKRENKRLLEKYEEKIKGTDGIRYIPVYEDI